MVIHLISKYLQITHNVLDTLQGSRDLKRGKKKKQFWYDCLLP